MRRWLARFFHYLDRYFIARRLLPGLNVVSTTTFRDLVYNSEQFREGVMRQILIRIDKERDGELVDHSVLKAAVNMYVDVGHGDKNFYETDCEAHILRNTTVYYSREAAALIVQDSCPEYMLKAEERLKEEKQRVSDYLDSSSETKLLEKVQHELLTVVSSQLLDKEHSGYRALLRDDKVDDLSRMYRLFSKINKGLDPVALTFKQHVTDEGLALLKKTEDAASNKKAENREMVGLQEQSFVRGLIELYDRYFEYVTTCFSNHTLFHKSQKEAFEVFCTKTVAETSSAELLATFCDSMLRKGGSKEKLTEEVTEKTIEKVVKLLAFISDKDMFAEFSRKKLAKRLIQLSAKDEVSENERNLLTKLKQQYGGQYTSKMEGMVTDMVLAKEKMKNFAEYVQDNHPTGSVDFTARVLTTGFWPTYKSSDLNLPAEMVKCVEVFLDHYKTKTKHRKLTWIYSLGNCNVYGHFNAKRFDLSVAPYQAATLLLFNASDKLSYQEIKEQLNLSDEDVKRSLHSLSCAKYKILTKEPNNKTVSDTDVFEFNAKFTDKMTKIKVCLPPLSDERKKVVEDVGKDRGYAIDACLVRIMKSRKVLGYQQLVMECVDQLSKMFKPDIKQIKKRIEDLITREYLERDTENPNTFKHLA